MKPQIALLFVVTRSRNGLTQTQLARKMGMKQESISRIENTGICSLQTLEKLAKVFNKKVIINLTPKGN